MEAGSLTSHRSLVYEFDTLEQLASWKAFSPAAHGNGDVRPSVCVTEWFSSILRTADLLSGETVVLDTQLLDGAFFLHHGPESIKHLLGQTGRNLSRLRIASRHANLAESLRHIALGTQQGAGPLANFEFSSVASLGIDPTDLANELTKRDSRRLRNCASEDVADVLAMELQAASEGSYECTQPTGVFYDLASKWRAWIELADARLIEIDTWGRGSFDMHEAFRAKPLPHGFLPEELESLTIQKHISFLKENLKRSTIRAYLLGQRGWESPEHLDRLEKWWMSVYFDALALQHGANWLQLSNGTGGAVGGTTAYLAAEMHGKWGAEISRIVLFEGLLIDQLRDMSPCVFSFAKYKARYAIQAWQEEPNQDHSDDLAYAILGTTQPISRKGDQRAAGTRILLALIPAFLGVIASSLLSLTVGLWTVVISATLVLLAVPLAELLHLRSTRSKRMQAYINFPKAASR